MNFHCTVQFSVSYAECVNDRPETLEICSVIDERFLISLFPCR